MCKKNQQPEYIHTLKYIHNKVGCCAEIFREIILFFLFRTHFKACFKISLASWVKQCIVHSRCKRPLNNNQSLARAYEAHKKISQFIKSASHKMMHWVVLIWLSKSKTKAITEPIKSAGLCYFQPTTSGWNL